jgi:hypothetical protein
MKNTPPLTASGRLYVEAYAKQYEEEDLHAAVLLYKTIVTEHPDSRDAVNSRSQIQNIIHGVVPAEVLYEAQLKLAEDYIPSRSGPAAPVLPEPGVPA